MKVKVNLLRSNETKEIQINAASTIETILKNLNIKPDTVIVMENKKPLPIDDKLKDGQEISIMQVSSGG